MKSEIKLLLVEDNHSINQAITEYLILKGFKVDNTYNGLQALKKISDQEKSGNSYDIIILDRMMPLKTGDEFLQEIRDMSITTPVIMLSAKDTLEDKIEGLYSGADDYILKPFEMEELIARIEALHRRNNTIVKSSNLSEKFRLRNLDFDFLHNKVKIDNNNFNLTKRESEILKILLQNKNNLVRKDIDLNCAEDRSIDVHLHNLRKKLKENNYEGEIETIRGEGYRII